MTKKDYVLIAKVLKHGVDNHKAADSALEMVEVLAGYLACEFKKENPRFDRARFLTACGVTE